MRSPFEKIKQLLDALTSSQPHVLMFKIFLFILRRVLIGIFLRVIFTILIKFNGLLILMFAPKPPGQRGQQLLHSYSQQIVDLRTGWWRALLLTFQGLFHLVYMSVAVYLEPQLYSACEQFIRKTALILPLTVRKFCLDHQLDTLKHATAKNNHYEVVKVAASTLFNFVGMASYATFRWNSLPLHLTQVKDHTVQSLRIVTVNFSIFFQSIPIAISIAPKAFPRLASPSKVKRLSAYEVILEGGAQLLPESVREDWLKEQLGELDIVSEHGNEFQIMRFVLSAIRVSMQLAALYKIEGLPPTS